MSSAKPLKGIELIDCARANAKQGIVIAAKLCGYSSDIEHFTMELHQACHQIGVQVSDLSDLITEQPKLQRINGVDIQPDSHSKL
jgi:hypothetical protein